MKLLLFLEHRFFINNKNQIYCERIVNYDFIKRYLNIFDEVCICARTQKVSDDFKTKLKVDGKGVTILPLPDFKGSKGIIKEYFKCKKIIIKNIYKYDRVIIRGPSPISLIALNSVLKAKKFFAVEFVVNPKTAFNRNTMFSKLVILIQKIFVHHAKKLCKKANGVSYVTENVLQKEYPCMAIIEPTNKKYFTESYSTLDVRKDDFYCYYDLKDEDPFKIIHVGYMDKLTKGQIEVMKVTKQLINKGYNIITEFVGTGQLEEEFKNFAKIIGIEKNIIFKGQLYGYKEIKTELLKSNLFLFPTRSEGLPRVLIEAMGNSLPCIAAPIDGIIELLNKEELINFDDINGMVKRIEEFIKDRELCRKIGIKNYNKALTYTREKLEIKRNSFYKKLKLLSRDIK